MAGVRNPPARRRCHPAGVPRARPLARTDSSACWIRLWWLCGVSAFAGAAHAFVGAVGATLPGVAGPWSIPIHRHRAQLQAVRALRHPPCAAVGEPHRPREPRGRHVDPEGGGRHELDQQSAWRHWRKRRPAQLLQGGRRRQMQRRQQNEAPGASSRAQASAVTVLGDWIPSHWIVGGQVPRLHHRTPRQGPGQRPQFCGRTSCQAAAKLSTQQLHTSAAAQSDVNRTRDCAKGSRQMKL